MSGRTIDGREIYYLLWSIDLNSGFITHHGVYETEELAWKDQDRLARAWLHFNVHECVITSSLWDKRKLSEEAARRVPTAPLKSNPDIATVYGGSKREKRRLRDYILGKQKQREPRGWMAPREGGYRPRKGQQKVSNREPVVKPPAGGGGVNASS